MWNLLSKVHIFRGKKTQPYQSTIILTRNNEQELRKLLEELSSDPMFLSGKGVILIIDHYSLDRTEETARKFIDKYPNQINWKKKNPLLTTTDYLHALLTEPLIQVINLKDWRKNELHAPIGLLNQKTGRVKWAFSKFRPIIEIHPKVIIDQLESHCKNLYGLIHENLLEPISIQRMKLETLKLKQGDELAAPKQLIDRILLYLRTMMIRLDPERFYGDKLSPCIAVAINEFTERTQLSCTLLERGKEPQVDYFVGISVMRILEEILDLVANQHKKEDVRIRIRWSWNKIIIRFHCHFQKKLTGEEQQLLVAEERVSYLNGKLRIVNNQNITILIPNISGGKGK